MVWTFSTPQSSAAGSSGRSLELKRRSLENQERRFLQSPESLNEAASRLLVIRICLSFVPHE